MQTKHLVTSAGPAVEAKAVQESPLRGIGRGHELSDVSIRGLLRFTVGFIICAVFLHLVVWVLFRAFAARHSDSFPAEKTPVHWELVPKPHLQISPADELRQDRLREEETLNGYGWVNREKEIVRIPIQRALELVAQEGLPTRQTEKPASPK